MFNSASRWFALAVGVGAWLSLTTPTLAETLFLQPIADTTLIETAPDNNLGGADFFNAGTAGNGQRNRALVLYDLSAIPAGAIITSAELTMDIVRVPATGAQFSDFTLRRVLESWGEGNQVAENPDTPGRGSLALNGEATWIHRFAGGAAWTQPGGTYAPAVSASTPGGGLGDTIQFHSTPALIADAQFWLDNPGQNFGWLLKSESEGTGKTARSFASSEREFGPTLMLEFTVVPEPSSAALGIAGMLAGLATWRRRK